ncbi:site-specific integrase [Clostridium sp. AN503]|uniref:site-specific integrase n=1 Tax=Clostridium sp. AN503 TaxID=3160598 RepID=UPI0034576441
MPVYQDETTKTWYVKCYYTDWTGARKQKMKRGFTRQRDAKAWERVFLEQLQGDPDMTFRSLYELYLTDIRQRLKASTVTGRISRCEHNILPYFENKQINRITPADVRKWQGEILSKNFKPTYQKTLNEQLDMIFNFATKYYGLRKNPCDMTGTIGRSKSGRMDFWTKDEFQRFIECVPDPQCNLAFQILFYTGLRCGELLALVPGDINLDSETLTVTKTFRREHGTDVITSPKTENSIRTVTLPPSLVEQLRQYIAQIYDIAAWGRLFPFTRSKLRIAMEKGCTKSGVKKIRIHDIRHSHVSLLIDMGFQPLLIAERIGDTVEMVNDIYGHLYPNKHRDLAAALDSIVSK